MKKRFVLAAAMAATAALALTACQQGSASGGGDNDNDGGGESGGGEEVVTLEFQSLSDQPLAMEAVQGIVDSWNADNPDIQVELVQAGWDGIYDKLITQFNGGTAPDIIHYEAGSIAPFAVDGYLADLTDLINPDFASDVSEGIWESVTVNDQIIAYPTTLQSYMVFANTDLLEAAGVEVPTGATMTWDELREIAQATTTDGQYGLGWGLSSPTATFMSLGLGFDGGYFEGSGSDVTIDVGEGELAVPEAIHQMAYEDLSLDPVSLTQSGSEVLPSWYAGETALTVQGSFRVASIGTDAPEGFNWTVLPPLEGSVSADQAANPQTYSVNIDSEHVEESAQFLDFFTSTENLAALAYADALVPASASARDALAEQTADENGWAAVLASGDSLVAPPFLTVDAYTQWKDTVATPAFQRFLADEIDSAQLQADLTDGWEQVNR
ncbi:ABC transporter substrate-binding protein [Pseudactinotalea terrae]|uniref:ABC transporter substrate-binding protein n=1 Tax=Pseudactinotalea terrae TaxID=1743262 RepID=UPI0012E30BA0|nr:sugar ABC transporter substrate-binding protein [Pseudactinotalea terrae]